MKGKSFLTVEDLVNFFDSHKIYNFSSKETGKKIVVKSVQDFSSKFEVDEESNKLFAKVRVCHTLLNRNGSYIPEESMINAMPSLKYDPLLASIHQLDDGSWDFHSHDFHVVENKDGDEEIVYDEHQVGTFTNDDPYLEYDNVMDKTYVVAKVAIPVEYTKTADIIQEKGETKVSCEISVNSCSYDAKNKYLVIDDFEFLGCTLLGSEKDGTPIGEGMLGSKLTLEDFSADNNSLFANFENKMNELQDRLSKLESACSDIQFSKEGGNQEKMENLIVDEQIKNVKLFDDPEEGGEPEGTGNDNTETQEEQNGQTETNGTDTPTGGNDNAEQGNSDNEQTSTPGANDGGGSGSDPAEEQVGDDPEPVIVSDDDEQETKRVFTINDGVVEFSISLNEKIRAIGDLVNATYSEVDNTYYGVTAYDKYVVMEDWFSGRFFKQDYSEVDGVFSLVGERVEVFAEFVTEDELNSLNEMRNNYSSILDELNKYKYAEEYADKMTVFDDESYSDYLDTDEFKAIMEKEFVDKYSKEELSEKADATLGKLVKASKKFSYSTKPVEKKVSSIRISDIDTVVEKKPYGNLFD